MRFPKGTTEHPINRGKRKFLVSIWDFGAVHPQGERSYYLCNDHPAKMRPALAKAILRLYGESPVLDPMAGIGTTLVEAMLLGLNAIGVEYEQKFVDQTNKNIKHVQEIHSSKNLGMAVCIKGDARDLSCLNNRKFNGVVFSPPYSEGMGHIAGKNAASKKYPWRLEFQRKMTEVWSNGSIARLRYGSIVFSPPYFNAIKKGGEGPHATSKRISYSERVARFQGYSDDEGNIGNVSRFGSIIFSPPYCGVMDAKRHVGGITSRDPQLAKTGFYSRDEGNIGNVAQLGSIIFSPPYGEANRGKGIAEKGYEGVHGKDEKLNQRCDRPISGNPNNIGNFRYGTTYLGEMFKVYRECFRVLKPGKFMVVVVKDIQRNWKTIPLGADTIKICQLAGFDLHDIIVNKKYFPSFWMVNLAKKSQTNRKEPHKFHVLKTHEYVLVFRKPLYRC